METKAYEFDRAFGEGEDVTDGLDVTKVRRIHCETRRVNVDFPGWMIRAPAQEARRLGIARQALIELWIANRLEQRKASQESVREMPSLAFLGLGHLKPSSG